MQKVDNKPAIIPSLFHPRPPQYEINDGWPGQISLFKREVCTLSPPPPPVLNTRATDQTATIIPHRETKCQAVSKRSSRGGGGRVIVRSAAGKRPLPPRHYKSICHISAHAFYLRLSVWLARRAGWKSWFPGFGPSTKRASALFTRRQFNLRRLNCDRWQ